MRALFAGLALGAILLGPAAAQDRTPDSTAHLLQAAHELYERLEVERALPLLRRVLSPDWAFAVTTAQRVDAYTFLAACLVLLGQGDSAAAFFRAALENDPFTDLDPRRFTPEQLAAFQNARRLTFAVGARPVSAVRVDPRTERLTFTVVTTHAAALQVEVRSADAPVSRVLYHGESEGLREIPWDGLVAEGRLAPPGRYELRVDGRSRLRGRSDSARVYFDVRHQLPALEDTLPDLGPRRLLPEHYPPSAAIVDLAKGLGVAAGVALLAALADRRLGSGGSGLPAAAAAAASVSGVVAFVWRRRHRDVPANIPENIRRRQERHAANEATRSRNEERIAQTILLIAPASGLGP
jgi:hypothetical protein